MIFPRKFFKHQIIEYNLILILCEVADDLIYDQKVMPHCVLNEHARAWDQVSVVFFEKNSYDVVVCGNDVTMSSHFHFSIPKLKPSN